MDVRLATMDDIPFLNSFNNGFVPVAGCAEDNIASRLTLEKCGLVSKLCLINFHFLQTALAYLIVSNIF
jgi:hypothetical protein